MSTAYPASTGSSENKKKNNPIKPWLAIGGNPEYDNPENDFGPKIILTTENSSEKTNFFSASGSIILTKIEGHHTEQSIVNESPAPAETLKNTTNYIFGATQEGLSQFGKLVMLGAPAAGEALLDLGAQIAGVGQKQEKKEPNQAKQAEEAAKKASLESRKQQVAAEIRKMQTDRGKREIVNEKRVQTNQLLGLQKTFEGTVDENGNVKTYYETLTVIKQEEITKEQREKARAQALAQSTKKGRGGVNIDQNKAAEGGTLSTTGGGGVG
jgi:hypothetical protein